MSPVGDELEQRKTAENLSESCDNHGESIPLDLSVATDIRLQIIGTRPRLHSLIDDFFIFLGPGKLFQSSISHFSVGAFLSISSLDSIV